MTGSININIIKLENHNIILEKIISPSENIKCINPSSLTFISAASKFLFAANISFKISDGNNNEANGNPSVLAGILNSNLLAYPDGSPNIIRAVSFCGSNVNVLISGLMLF